MSQKATLNLDKLSFTDTSSNVGSIEFASDAFTVSKPVSFSNGISASNISVSGGGTISVSALSNLKLAGDTSGEITVKAADTTTNYQIKMPDAQGGASTVLTNDGSGNLSWGVGGGGGANQALIWAKQGYVDLATQPTSVGTVPIDSLSNPNSTVYGGMTSQEYGASNRSTNIITIPTSGWYSIKFFYSHPALAIDGTGAQQGLGSDCKVYIKINNLNWEPFGSEDSAAGVSESSAVVMERYLVANNTVEFGWEFGSSQPNEDFFVSASLTNTQYINSNNPVFTGATASAAGTTGDVPQPLSGQENYLLHGDGSWKGLNLMGGATSSTQGSSGLVPIPAAGFQNYKLHGNAAFRKPYHIQLYRNNLSNEHSTNSFANFEGAISINNLSSINNFSQVTLPAYSTFLVSCGIVMASGIGGAYADWDFVDSDNVTYFKLVLFSANRDDQRCPQSSGTTIITTGASSINVGLKLISVGGQTRFSSGYLTVVEI